MVLMMTAIIVLEMATKNVLNIYNEKLPLLRAMVKLSNVQSLGINVGLVENSSADGLKAEKMMYMTGRIKRSAKAIEMT
jgi:hypothetical protein